MVYSTLRRSGVCTALYTSPHLVDLRERMIVDDLPITHDAFVHWTERLRDQVLENDASFFEATTAIAFADFAARGVDVAVVEVGLGGRLDATNVLSPLACAVTNVGLEHTEYLGDTLEEIAGEKAGIAKPDTPFIIGERDQDLAALLEEFATKRGAIARRLPHDQLYEGRLALEGVHQRRNAALAETILRCLPPGLSPEDQHVHSGIEAAFVPGRFDRRGKWIFDVAHNAAGFETLVDQIRSLKPRRPVHALVSMAHDKDWRTMLVSLRENVNHLWLTLAPSMPSDRRPDLEQMIRELGANCTVETNFDRALDGVAAGAGTVVVAGSFFTVGDAMARLPGFAPLG